MSDKKVIVPRRPDGTIMPGRSLNPGGKVKGIERRMRELIDQMYEDWDGKRLDGWEAMTVMLYQVAMGKAPPGNLEGPITMKDRMAAAQFLFDRVHGKAKIMVESDTTLRAGSVEKLDVDALSAEELDALDAHVEILAAKASGKSTQKVLDISPADVIELEELDKQGDT